MKNYKRILCAMLLLTMLAVLIPMQVFAESRSFRGTVGEYCYFKFFYDDQDIVEFVDWTDSVPGMSMYNTDGEVSLTGTPTKAGRYAMTVWVFTQRSGKYEFKLDILIEEPYSDGVPVITKHPSGEKVVEGDSVTFIAKATNAKQYVWEIAIADGVVDCADLPSYIGGGVKVSGAYGETLTISNVSKKLNETYVRCRVVGAESSVYSDYAKITVLSLDDVKPEITKHPSEETVTEGEGNYFTAEAKYAKECIWQFVSPDGKTGIDANKAAEKFPGLKVSGHNTQKLVLDGIPLEVNGWKVQCKFVGGKGDATTRGATITVLEDPNKPEPTQETTLPEETEEPETLLTEPVTQPETEPEKETETQALVIPEVEEQGLQVNKTGVILLVVIVLASFVILAAIAVAVVLIIVSKRKKK